MDERAKTEFRWKFYHLAIELNVIILLVALSILFLFLFPQRMEGLRYPLIIVMLVIAGILTLDFRKRYMRTKAWLHEQPDTTGAEHPGT